MAIYVYWFLLALVLLGLEVATGTFYLLVLSLAMAVGGIAALLGLGMPAQLVVGALAAVAGIIVLRRWKGTRVSDAASQNLDTGLPVKVLAWHDDGTARVYFRGAEWDAELDTADSGREGTFYIKAMRGSVIILSNHKPA
jgi:membrane protein implicated in regulation of membrane protease activity